MILAACLCSRSILITYKSLKTKEKSNWLIPKIVAVTYESSNFFITKFKSQFKWSFTKVVITRAGCVQEWSQGELRLHMKMQVVPITVMIFFPLIFACTVLPNYLVLNCIILKYCCSIFLQFLLGMLFTILHDIIVIAIYYDSDHPRCKCMSKKLLKLFYKFWNNSPRNCRYSPPAFQRFLKSSFE